MKLKNSKRIHAKLSKANLTNDSERFTSVLKSILQHGATKNMSPAEQEARLSYEAWNRAVYGEQPIQKDLGLALRPNMQALLAEGWAMSAKNGRLGNLYQINQAAKVLRKHLTKQRIEEVKGHAFYKEIHNEILRLIEKISNSTTESESWLAASYLEWLTKQAIDKRLTYFIAKHWPSPAPSKKGEKYNEMRFNGKTMSVRNFVIKHGKEIDLTPLKKIRHFGYIVPEQTGEPAAALVIRGIVPM
jgi:hypothetical protein